MTILIATYGPNKQECFISQGYKGSSVTTTLAYQAYWGSTGVEPSSLYSKMPKEQETIAQKSLEQMSLVQMSL